MSLKNKKFPKLKKSLKKFLTDESGKITQKDALGISIGAALFAGIGEASAIESSTYTQNSPTSLYPSDAEAYQPPNHSNTVANQIVLVSDNTCNHASGIVNGHYSSIPSVNLSNDIVDLTNTHGSHSSHSNHGDGGWC